MTTNKVISKNKNKNVPTTSFVRFTCFINVNVSFLKVTKIHGLCNKTMDPSISNTKVTHVEIPHYKNNPVYLVFLPHGGLPSVANT